MKILIFFFSFITFSTLYAQDKITFNVGDEIEYFDGINWVDSKIVEVGINNNYLVYIDKQQSKTKWFPAEDINLLYKSQDDLFKKETMAVQQAEALYKAGDIVSFSNGTKVIESEIIQVNTDNKYQVFYDETKSSTLWINESQITLVSPKK